jgi:hypothetical protein
MTTLRRVAILAADPRLPPSLAEEQLKKLATIHTLYLKTWRAKALTPFAICSWQPSTPAICL